MVVRVLGDCVVDNDTAVCVPVGELVGIVGCNDDIPD